jgi:GTP-binding protein
VLLLIDASIPPMEKDKEYADWLIEHNVPFTIVFTKCDRNKPGLPSVEENQEELVRQLMVSINARYFLRLAISRARRRSS